MVLSYKILVMYYILTIWNNNYNRITNIWMNFKIYKIGINKMDKIHKIYKTNNNNSHIIQMIYNKINKMILYVCIM